MCTALLRGDLSILRTHTHSQGARLLYGCKHLERMETLNRIRTLFSLLCVSVFLVVARSGRVAFGGACERDESSPMGGNRGYKENATHVNKFQWRVHFLSTGARMDLVQSCVPAMYLQYPKINMRGLKNHHNVISPALTLVRCDTDKCRVATYFGSNQLTLAVQCVMSALPERAHPIRRHVDRAGNSFITPFITLTQNTPQTMPRKTQVN